MSAEKEKNLQTAVAEAELNEDALEGVVGGISVPRVPTHDYDEEVKGGI